MVCGELCRMATEDQDVSSGESGAQHYQFESPGSTGERVLQARFDTLERAKGFYDNSMQTSLTERMQSYVRARKVAYLGTATADGRPGVIPIAGEPGVVQVLDENHLACPVGPEPGKATPLQSVPENPHATLTFVDWFGSTVGLHVNGSATVESEVPGVENRRNDPYAGDWLVLNVEEAYIHCAKHIPKLEVATPVEPTEEETVRGRAVLDRLPSKYQRFVGSRFLTFLATADSNNETDVSPRIGPPGFVQVIDETTVAWPEYRGNGVHASLGNLLENPTATLLFGDWWGSDIVVNVSGSVSLKETVDGAVDLTDVDRTKTWVEMDVGSVTVNQRPYFPTLRVLEFDPPWGTDNPDAKNVGFFTPD